MGAAIFEDEHFGAIFKDEDVYMIIREVICYIIYLALSMFRSCLK